MPIIYRIQHPERNAGLWYNDAGVPDPYISDGPCAAITTLPMPIDLDTYKYGGLDWISACDSLAMLHAWFPEDAANELAESGHKLFEIEVSRLRFTQTHVLFTHQDVVASRAMEFNHLFKS